MYKLHKITLSTLSCVALMFSSLTLAASAVDTTESTTAVNDSQSSRAWFGSVSATYNDNYANDYRDDKSVDLGLSVGYHLQPTLDLSFTSTVTYQQNQFCTTHSKDYWCMSNSYVYLTKKQLFDLGDYFQVNMRARLLLPTSRYSQDTHLHTAAGLYVPLNINLDPVLKGFTVIVTPSVNKYFHKYKTAGNKNLTEYTFATSFVAVYDWSDKWEAIGSASYTGYRTYKGYNKYPNVEIIAELDYQLSSSLSIGMGYTNNAQYYNPEHGRNPINNLLDDKDPYFYLTSSYGF